MLERFPVDVRHAAELLLAPAKQLEIVLGRVIAKPVDIEIFFQSGLAHRAPDLDHPAEHPEVIVDPVERAADDLLRVITELVIDGDVRVAGKLAALRADALVVPEILGVHLRVRQMIERTQQHAAPGMERDTPHDVGMTDDEIGHRPDLGLRGREGPSPELLILLPPIARKIAI